MTVKKRKDPVSLQLIYSRISDYDIYRYEIGNFSINHAFCNPLRKDNNPSFVIYMNEAGNLRHKDFADSSYSGSGVEYVQQKYGLSVGDAMRKIAKNFGLLDEDDTTYKEVTSSYTKPVMDQKRYTFIQVKVRKWEKRDLDYWGQFGISVEELKAEAVYPLSELFINRRRDPFRQDELVYAYKYETGFKIYFPQREKGERWKSNIKTSIVENIKILQELDPAVVLITKSKKDRLVLSRYFPYVMNVQNESRSCFTPEFVEMLRGRDVWINYDSDEAGVKNCTNITSEFGYKYINVPKNYLPVKDFADLYKEHGEEEVINVLKQKNLI